MLFRSAKLRKRVAEQDEMEEEGEDLRKESSAFISDDEDYLEETDYEEDDDEEEPTEPLLDEDEEDPEERAFESDTDVVVLSAPPQ